jgi:hypothetical protein
MPVSKRTRYEVLKRDNHTCRYCGATAPDAILTVDHVTPVALGGSDAPDNLVAACRDCNYGKASTSPDATAVEDVKQLDLAWADALKRAAAALSVATNEAEDYFGLFCATWPQYRYLPNDAETSVRRLYEAGLPAEHMTDAARIASSQRGVYDRFSYFMGICWRRVTEIQETAKQILAAEEGAD